MFPPSTSSGAVAPGRNDPCPCGSGKRFKQCHGAIAADSRAPAPDPQARFLEGLAAHQAGDLDTAEARYREVLAASADFPPAIHYLGTVLYQRGRLPEALELLGRSVAQMPQEPEFHSNLGLALAAGQRFPEAIAAFRQALVLKPDHATAWNNLGLALQASGEIDAAVDAYRQGLASAPDLAALHWNLALALLLQGRYADGWREYAWRERAPEFAPFLPRQAVRRYDGTEPPGQTVLLSAEQGLGDAIQTLRFAQRVAARGHRVVAGVPLPLRALAATAPGVADTCAVDEVPAGIDAQAPLMSLPTLFGITLADVAPAGPYLRADPARVARAEAQVARAAPRTLRVGIAWAGAPGNTLNARRSLPLADCLPLLETEGVTWFSLKRSGEVFAPEDIRHTGRLVELDLRNDFDDLAALIAALDLVVSVDTSIAHLAGALGKPVWVLLSRVPDWRWLLDRDDSPWYPSARLFRQHVAGDWSTPVAEAQRALRALVAQRQR